MISGKKNCRTCWEKQGEDSLLHMKMQDVGVLYQAFLQYLEGHYMTGEGVMDALKKAIPFSDKLKKYRTPSGWLHRFYSGADERDPGTFKCLR